MAGGGEVVTLQAVLAWIDGFAATVAENKDYLTKLDSAIGDADHGINMNRGMRAALERLEASPPDDIGAALKTVGMAMVSKVGGASGPLYGTFFLQLAGPLAGKESVTLEEWAGGIRAAVSGVMARGKAELGDKTMIDALVPAVEALEGAVTEGASIGDGLTRAADAAAQGMEATTPLVARKGRASYLGERSAGHQDPGATSSHLLMRTAADTLAQSGQD
ncbi:MAG TPA: dihydroxyacetone kinase subunit DhaL [Acidimicrobiia bacterium]|nr:dihydroxyacetone kinase subunit DhaL [Acidimicrobiia bacterium]